MSRFDFKSAGDIPRSIATAFRQLHNLLTGLRRVQHGFLFENTIQFKRVDAGDKTGTDDLSFTTNWMKVRLTGNWTPTFSNTQPGAVYILEIQQGVAGSHTVTFPSGVNFGTPGAPTITTTANRTDLIILKAVTGTTYYGFTEVQNL